MPRQVVVRPLRDLARKAEQLGFELLWNDEPHGAGSRFIVRLEPRTERAREAIVEASGMDDCEALEASTIYQEGDAKFDVYRQTGEHIIEMARAVL